MSNEATIHAKEFARKLRILKGKIPLSSLTRLNDTLFETAGDLHFCLEGQMSAQKKPELFLVVTGTLTLSCQRCLEAMPYPVAVSSRFEIVKSEAALTEELFHNEAVDFLVDCEDLNVAALIEEEVILHLPMSPRHEHCVLQDEVFQAKKDSPFAMLKKP